MITELNRRMGVQSELLGPPEPNTAYNAIERALNDALLQTVLRYRHTEFESDDPYYFSNLAVSGSDASNSAGSDSFDTFNANIGLEPDGVTQISSLTRWIDGAVELAGLGCHTIVSVTDFAGNVVGPFTPPYRVTIAPSVQAANTAAGYAMAARRYPLPFSDGDGEITNPVGVTKRIFFIYNLTDISNNVPLHASDVRLADRSVPEISQPIYYDRVKNDLFIHPAPFFTNYDGSSGKLRLRLRYAYRPSFKTTTDTFYPLPEEWQEVVMLEAYAKLLDMENEHDRATATRAASAELAAQIMVPFYEEMDDAEPAFIPMKRRW